MRIRPVHRFGRYSLPYFLTSLFFLVPSAAPAGEVWEIWSRLCFSKDMTTEWLVADDKSWTTRLPPEKTTLYFLIPPVIQKVQNHWEITFDVTGKVKDQLAEHFDNSKAFRPMPSGYRGVPRNQFSCQLEGKNNTGRWLIICSRNFLEGKHDPLNLDIKNTGSPYDFTLDPEDAVGICFLEPVVTEKDGEWILTIKEPLEEKDKTRASVMCNDWMKDHPGPKSPKQPKEVYSREMQKKYDAWEKALRQWQEDGAKGIAPDPDDFLKLTPEQKEQEEEWRRAQTRWRASGGQGPFPQPTDFIKD